MENENRRSGIERRSETSDISNDRREGPDRRSFVNDTERMIEFMRKIPVFNGLTNDQYKKLLYICYNKQLPAECYIYEEGEKSDSLFILLRGRIRLLYNKNTLVTTVDPVTLFGEDGFYTNKPRQISAVTSIESTIIKINKIELYRVFHADSSLCNRVQTNVISQLSLKLERYTEIINDLRSFKDNHNI